MKYFLPCLCALLVWGGHPAVGMAAVPAVDFARDVRPLLAAHCLKCHGPEKQMGGLRFDTREGAFQAGDSGEQAIVPGKPAQSRLMHMVSSKDEDERMPPKGDPLSAAQIDVLKRWIDGGAPWQENSSPAGPAARAEMIVTDADRRHWSFLPLTNRSPPEVTNRSLVRTPVDRFVLARLEEKQLTLAPSASAGTLVRRISFDLVGLPPTPQQVEAFVEMHQRDPRAAVAALVEELLASPHYGERWARHWLDVARYADSDGQESDADRPNAYHFRDFVIRALNDDLPMDQFLRWQLAGDELEPDNPRAIAATGFIAAGTTAGIGANLKLMEEERIRERFNELDDMIATTGSAMLGLTLACARCHDHKYDPVPTREYYRLQSAFNGGDRGEAPLAPQAEVRRQRELEKQWNAEHGAAKQRLEEWVQKMRETHGPAARRAKIDALDLSEEEKSLLKNDPEGATAKELAARFSKQLQLKDQDTEPFASEAERAEGKSRERALQSVEGSKPQPLPTAFAFSDFGATPRETFLLARGDFRRRVQPLEIGFLSVLTRGKTPEDYWAAARADARRDDSTQQRRALAEWLTDLEHGAGPLAARVLVNRVWQHHFGEGLVRTVNDFGARADPPTHPELLEWSANDFVRGGWKLKSLHRLIVNSSAYLQGGAFNEAAAKADPENRLLGRRRSQRLSAETLRDSILAVSGTLNEEMFGPSVRGPIAAEAMQARNLKDAYPSDVQDTPAVRRRSIYMFHKRVVPSPLMQVFDSPDAAASCGRRETTTVAPQALALLNDPFLRARSADFAQRLAREAGSDSASQVRHAWRLALGRDPSAAELELGVAFIDRQAQQRQARQPDRPPAQARHLALTDFCQSVFALNEFIYVD